MPSNDNRLHDENPKKNHLTLIELKEAKEESNVELSKEEKSSKKDIPNEEEILRETLKKEILREETPKIEIQNEEEILRKETPKIEIQNEEVILRKNLKEEILREETPKRKIQNEEEILRETLKKEISNQEILRKETPKIEIQNEEEILRKETPKIEIQNEEVILRKIQMEEEILRETLKKEILRKIQMEEEILRETLKKEILRENLKKEILREETPKRKIQNEEEILREETPKKETPKEESKKEETPKKEKESKGNEDLKNLIGNLYNATKIIGTVLTLVLGYLSYNYIQLTNSKIIEPEYDSKQIETYLNPLMERIGKGIQPENPPYGKILPNKDLQEFLKSLKSEIPNKKKSCAMRIIVGQNHTGKTTALMNELKDVENVLYLSFRESNYKSLTFEQILGEQLGIPSEITKKRKNLPSKVLKSAIEKISEQGKQIVLILEDLNNVILYPQNYDKELKKFNLPDYLATFCNGLMQYVAFDKCQIFITVSDPSRSSCFGQISGSNRIEYHSFVVARDEQVEKMLLEDVPFLKQKFGSFTSLAAKVISEKIGGDMGTLMRTLDKLENKEVKIEDIKTNKDVLNIVSKSLSIPNKFSRFVESRLVSNSEDPLHSESKAALMIDTLLRCSNESKGTPLLLGDENFFNKFKKSSPNKDVRIIRARDLNEVKQILEEEDLFYKISSDDKLYLPFRRILIEEWKNWESKLSNRKDLEATRQALIDSQKIEFPKPEDVKRTCATLFGPKSRN